MWMRQIYDFFLRWQGLYPISLLTCVPLFRLVLQPKTTHALFPPCRAYSSNVVAPGIACVFGRTEWGVSPVNKGVWGGVFFTWRAAPRERAVIIDFASNRLNINVNRLNMVNPVIGHLVINDFALSGGGKAL